MDSGFSSAGVPLAVRPLDSHVSEKREGCVQGGAANNSSSSSSSSSGSSSNGGKVDKKTNMGAHTTDDDDDDDMIDEEDVEEAAKPKVAKSPKGPTAAEREEHEITHLPFRDWCSHCVRGRATDDPHRRGGAKQPHEVPTVSMDYCYVGQRQDDKNTPILIIRCDTTKSICSHPVLQKGGAYSWVSDRVVQDINNMGHGKIILKCDQEPAIMEVHGQVMKKRAHETIPEHSPVGEHQSNGIAERAVRTVKDQIRTLKSALDARLGKRVPPEATILLWLIEYSGILLSRFAVGQDGKTAYQRIKGRTCSRPMAEFGECVWYKKLQTQDDRHADMEPRWEEGIWVGINPRTNEVLIGTPSGVIRAKAIRRRTKDERWSYDKVMEIKGAPWDPAATRANVDHQTHIHEADSKEDDGREEADAGHQARPVYIRKQDIEEFGATPGCAGCVATAAGKRGVAHTKACRKRIEDCMKSTERGKQRLEEAEKRTNDALARNVEAAEKKRKQQEEAKDEDHRAKRKKNDDDTVGQEKRKGDQRDHEDNADEGEESHVPGRHAKQRRVDLNKLTFYDDVTNEKLNTAMVIKARSEEIGYFKKHKVYRKVPRDGKKVIAIKWIDINKGDNKTPNVRSRLVAKEFRQKKENDLFAGTPPVESLRYLLSSAARCEKGSVGVMVNDVSRAYFYARTQRPIHVEIPPEDYEDGDEYNCAELDFSMYGTRDAAANWQRKCTEVMKQKGFRQGKASPCHFWHPTRDIKTMIHGDDFVSVGEVHHLSWLEAALNSEFTIKTSRIDLRRGSDRELRVLNRVIRIGEHGLEYEADPRQAELIVREAAVASVKDVATPAIKREGENEEMKMDATSASLYRSAVARCNYLAADRPDIAYATKCACQRMADPCTTDWDKVERIARYLRRRPRLVYKFDWAYGEHQIVGYSDTDWGGDRITRKSTSGGVATIAGHLIKSWCKLQTCVASSSGEAELYGCNKTTSECLGLQSIALDFGTKHKVSVCTDSSAALGIIQRFGLGKTKHIDLEQLWCQEMSSSGRVMYRKVAGTANPADMLTKAVDESNIMVNTRRLQLAFMSGRAVSAPHLTDR